MVLIYQHELNRKPPSLVTIVDLIHRDALAAHWMCWSVIECHFMILHQHHIFSQLLAEIIAWIPHFCSFLTIPYFALGVTIRYVLIVKKSIQLDAPDESVVTFFRLSTAGMSGLIIGGFKLAGVKPRSYSTLANEEIDDFVTITFCIAILSVLIVINVVLRVLIYFEQRKMKYENPLQISQQMNNDETTRKNGNTFVILLCVAFGFFMTVYNR